MNDDFNPCEICECDPCDCFDGCEPPPPPKKKRRKKKLIWKKNYGKHGVIDDV